MLFYAHGLLSVEIQQQSQLTRDGNDGEIVGQWFAGSWLM